MVPILKCSLGLHAHSGTPGGCRVACSTRGQFRPGVGRRRPIPSCRLRFHPPCAALIGTTPTSGSSPHPALGWVVLALLPRLAPIARASETPALAALPHSVRGSKSLWFSNPTPATKCLDEVGFLSTEIQN